MEKALIVIGEATTDQLQPARLRILEQGHSPKVKRVTFDKLYLGSSDLFEEYATEDEKIAEGRDPAGDELTDRLAARHLESFGSIGAIVLSEDDWQLTSDSDFTWVTGVIEVYSPDDFSYWIIRPDGQTEIA